MSNLIRFKLKMFIVLTFCVFMTFSMLIYVMNLTEKCESSEDETCYQVSKSPVTKTTLFYYSVRDGGNNTEMTTETLKPSFTISGKVVSERGSRVRSTNETKTSEFFKVLNMYKVSLGGNSSREPLRYSISTKRFYSVQPLSFSGNLSLDKKSEMHSQIESNFSNARKKLMGQYNPNIDVYLERRRKLQQNCQKYYHWEHIIKLKKIKFNHILIDEKHKILYCYVPKVACTNWKRIFLILTGKASNLTEVINLPSKKVHAKNLFKSLQNYTTSEVQNLTEEYTKFIFVRHPFERLLSAFRNKLEQHYDSSKYFQARFGKFIIKNFRKNPTNMSLEKGDDVTFDEFVSYVISSDPNLYNEHWQRVTDLCHPCLLNYDFVGKYESLVEDSNFLLKYLGYNISFPILPKPSKTASNLKKYFNKLDKSTIFKLYNIYEMDFKLFEYRFV